MEGKWSLKEIYNGFDDVKFKEDINKGKVIIEEFKVLANSSETLDDRELLEKYIKLTLKCNDVIGKAYEFCNLTYAVDTKDINAQRYMDVLENQLSSITEYDSKIKLQVGKVKNLEELVKDSEIIREHKFFIEEIINDVKYILSPEVENVIAKMKNTGSVAWAKLRDGETSVVKVKINKDGKEEEMPLTVARNLAYDKSEEVRKKAYEAELQAYKSIDESVAAALNGIKGEVITVTNLRGYESPLQEALFSSRMSEKTLEALISAIEEYYPVFRKYLKRKGEILGHKNGLPFYDLFAPIGELTREIPFEEGKKIVLDNFYNFSTKLGDFAKNAMENQWIDVYPRDGKVGGAFCSTITSIKESRVMLNYGGNFTDVVTMAHELGHGYHGSVLKDETAINNEYPMPLAETASTFCETLLKTNMINTLPKDEALTVLEGEISDATQVILDIMSRFIFEKEVFEKRKEAALSVEELCNIMIEAQKATYGDGLDENYLHPYMWICKPHYYDGDYNFYNYPYAFGQLFAKGLYKLYEEKGEAFIEEYDKLLKSTGKMNIVDVGKTIGIDFEDKSFWITSLKAMEKDIDKFLELTEDFIK